MSQTSHFTLLVKRVSEVSFCVVKMRIIVELLNHNSVKLIFIANKIILNDKLIAAVRENFDLRPAGIIEMLDLRRPIYRQTAAYGHFGRTDVDLPWEHTDKVDALLASVKA